MWRTDVQAGAPVPGPRGWNVASVSACQCSATTTSFMSAESQEPGKDLGAAVPASGLSCHRFLCQDLSRDLSQVPGSFLGPPGKAPSNLEKSSDKPWDKPRDRIHQKHSGSTREALGKHSGSTREALGQ